MSIENNTKKSILETDADAVSDEENILAIGEHKMNWQEILLLIAASLSILIIIAIFVFTLESAITIFPRINAEWAERNPDIQYPFFSKFLFGDQWIINAGEYGILPGVVATTSVVLIALVFGVPIGISTAFYLAEIASDRIRKVLKPSVEMLASIPSIVYGFIGWKTFVFFFEDLLGLRTGKNAFSAGLMLSIMILPTVISIADDAIKSVPQSFREGSLALGATKWQTMRQIIFPAAASGITAAIILAFGRAIGETMAVYMLSGGSPSMPEPFYNIFTGCDPLTSKIARELGEAAWSGTEYSALFMIAVILFAVTFIINLIGDVLIKRFAKRLTGGK